MVKKRAKKRTARGQPKRRQGRRRRVVYRRRQRAGFLPGFAKRALAGVLNTGRWMFCNGRARQLQPGEYHYGCHNFTGPGTAIAQPSVAAFAPYNGIDTCSRQHDLDYAQAHGNATAIHQADSRALTCYNQYKTHSGYLPAFLGIGAKHAAERLASAVRGRPITFYS